MSIPSFSEFPEIPQRSAPEADFDAKMVALFQHFALTHRAEMLAFIDFLENNSTVIGGVLNGTTIGLNTPAAAKFTVLEAQSFGGDGVQSSLGDTTADRLMKVGAFGVGGGAPVYDATDDFNDIKTGGMYTLSGQYINGPDGAGAFGYNSTLLVIQREFSAGASRTQILSRTHLKPDLRMRVGTGDPVTWTGWVKIPMPGDDVEFGALTVSGIDFGQTALDYYEEGSWTPVLTDGSSNATAVSNGTYTRVGDLVTLTGRIPVSSLGSLSGTLRIGGFPFVTINSSAAQGTGLIALSSGVNLVSANTMFLFTQQGNTFCYISEQNAGGTSGIQASEFTDTANIQFSLTYRTA